MGSASGMHEATSVDQVLATIQAALSNDSPTRSSAEATLRAWESDAAPGFLVSLLRIVEQHQAIDAVGGKSGHPGGVQATACLTSCLTGHATARMPMSRMGAPTPPHPPPPLAPPFGRPSGCCLP